MPMLRAVPTTMRIPCSTVLAFKSGIFNSAISRTLSRPTFATLSRLGTPEPFGIPAAFFQQYCSWWSLSDEVEATIFIYVNNYWNN